MSELGNTSIGKSNLLAFISKFLVHWSVFAGVFKIQWTTLIFKWSRLKEQNDADFTLASKLFGRHRRKGILPFYHCECEVCLFSVHTTGSPEDAVIATEGGPCP